MCCLLSLEERLHAARLALRQHQRLGQDDIFQLQRRPFPQTELGRVQCQCNLASSWRNNLPVDPVVSQEGQGLHAELGLEEHGLQGGQRGHLVDERAQRRSGSPGWAALHPVALPLEGVGGQRKLAPTVPAVEAFPVDGAPPHIKLTQAAQQLLPVTLARAKRGQKSCSLCLLATAPCSALTTGH